MLIHLHIVYACFSASVTELSHWNRLYGPQRLKYLLSDPFQKMFADSCSVSTWIDLITFVYSVDYSTLHWTFYNMQNESHGRIVNFFIIHQNPHCIKGFKKICLLLSNSFYKGEKTYIHQIYFKGIIPFKV